MKKEMNKEREYLNYVYNIITDKNYNVARKKIDELKKKKEFRTYRFEIEFLNSFLEEQIDFYGEKNNNIERFLSGGRDALYFDEKEEALDYFSAGIFVTDHPLFYYLMGKTLYMIQDRQDEGVMFLEKYIEKNGASKAYKAYNMLEEYYYYIDPLKSKKYQKKRDKLMLIHSIDFVRKDKDSRLKEIEIVNELSKNNEIDKLYEMFPNSTDEIKLRIIGELYKRGYRKQADSIYKKNRREIEKHSKNSKRLVRQLDANKTLFINKGKHNIKG